MPLRLAEDVGKVERKAFVKNFFDELSDCLVTAKTEHLLERRIATRDTAVLIDSQQTDVHRLDDRLIELFQQRELFGMLLLFLIQTAVLDRDGNVTGNRLQDLKILG